MDDLAHPCPLAGDSRKNGRLFFRTKAYVDTPTWVNPAFKGDVLRATMNYQRYPQNYSDSSEALTPGDFSKIFVKHGHGSYLPKRGDQVEGITFLVKYCRGLDG